VSASDDAAHIKQWGKKTVVSSAGGKTGTRSHHHLLLELLRLAKGLVQNNENRMFELNK